MNLDKEGFDLIKRWEGYHSKVKGSTDCKAYLCPAGVWTIGYGCTKGVSKGMRISKAKAEAMFRDELAGHVAHVNKVVKTDLEQHEFNTLVSFAYNAGDGALSKSTLLKVLNRGDKSAVPAQLLRWTKHRNRRTGKRITSRGLTNRRMDEIKMWRGEHHEKSSTEDEVMPQAPEAEAVNTRPTAKNSKTITGTLFAAFGGVAVYASEAFTYLMDIATEAAGVAKIGSVLGPLGVDVKSIGLMVVIGGALFVISRRMSDASEGR